MKHLRLKTGLQFGIITSLLATLIGMALMFTGMMDYSGSSGGWTSMLIIGLGIYLASEGFKKRNDGFMSHSDLFVISLWLGLFSGILSGVFGMIQFAMDPSLLEKMKNVAEARLESQGQSDEAIEQAMKIMDFMMEPIPLAMVTLISSLFFSALIGGILGFFLKNEKDVFS
jgi:hypothetical protein